MGAFDPDTPFLNGRYHFGLIWDGTGVDSCEGLYGHYMRFNSPHKLSLYVALGLPVIVWREAAIADFVLKQGIGVTVGNLLELDDSFHQGKLGRLSTDGREHGGVEQQGQARRDSSERTAAS